VLDDDHLYGGQVLAQGVRAAAWTLPNAEALPHSVHGYFLRRGTPRKPLEYEVLRDRDGRSYSSRRVIARQDGEIVVTMSVSFHVPEGGDDVQVGAMPDVPAPDVTDAPGTPGARPFPTGLLDVEFRNASPGQAYPTRSWFRTTAPVGDDPLLRALVLIYVSDIFLGVGTLQPLGDDVLLASIDHALWLYQPSRPDRWHLLDLSGERIGDGRNTYTGRIWSSEGVLVAGLAQEGLHRRIVRT
jgi:acyl-CoA thioesterase-2